MHPNPPEKQEEHSKEKDKQDTLSSYSPVFHIKEFKVGNLENASTINIGNNYPTNFRGYKRHSQGLGTIDGNNNDIHDLEAYINQRYLVDALLDREEDLPDWIKELIKNEESKILNEETPPEEGNNSIYTEIKTLLGVEQIPSFFEELAQKKELLKKVWEATKEKINNDELVFFYNEILKRLNQISILQSSSSFTKLENNLCREFAKSIEMHAKTLLMIIYLLQVLLPGYLIKYKAQEPHLSIDKLKEPSTGQNQQLKTEEVLKAIQQGFYLKQHSKAFLLLKDHQETLHYMFSSMIIPFVESGSIYQYINDMKELFNAIAEHIDHSNPALLNLTAEEQSFLYTHLIEYLEAYPKHIFLEYMVQPFCNQ